MILFVAIASQVLLLVNAYVIRSHRLAGHDFFNVAYIQTQTVLESYLPWTAGAAVRAVEAVRSIGRPPFPIVRYMDAAYLVFGPFTWLPPGDGLTLYLLANYLGYIGGAYLLTRALALQHQMIWIAIVAASAPVYHNLMRGHSFGLLFLILTVVVLQSSRRPIAAGLFLAMFFVHKPYLSLMVIPILAARRYRLAASAAVVSVLLALWHRGHFPSLEGVFMTLGRYHQHSTAEGTPVFLLQAGTSELLYRLFHQTALTSPLIHFPTLIRLLIAGSNILVLGISCVVLRRGVSHRGASITDWGVIISAALLVSPSLADYALSLALLPLLVAASVLLRPDRPASRAGLTAFALSALALCANFSVLRYPDLYGGRLPPIPNPEWIGLVMLWILGVRSMRDSKAEMRT